MASTTLTLPAEMASPATALSLCSAHDVILALDLGTTTGWALRSIDGSITSGTAEFRLDRWQSGGMRFLRFSGTTLIAAERTGRRARLIELDPKYADVAVQRWQDQTGQSARLEPSGQSFSEMTPSEIGAVASLGDDQTAKVVDVPASTSHFTLTSTFMSNSSSRFPR